MKGIASLRAPAVALAATIVLAGFAGLPGTAAAPEGCPGAPAWFLGVVYDEAKREDFQKDVDNFELYLATLRATHCIPEANARILAFEDDYARKGKVYPAATEAATKAAIAEFGAAAREHEDAVVFLFLSSHGNAYPFRSCPGGLRLPGSVAYLKAGGGDNGALYDCELGQALNTHLAPGTRLVAVIDCSFCGGFSDSLTAASGTLPDDSLPVASGILGPGRVVITGCAITTECFGGSDGGVTFGHLTSVLRGGVAACDGWTIPGFPAVQGINVPLRDALLNPPDGRCTASEWLFAAVNSAYAGWDFIGIQQQFRLKYGFGTLAEDVPIA